MIARESVLLPEPFGPMIACTEPLSITRSMPLRMGLPSTLTTRSRTSRLDMCALTGGGLRKLRQGHAIERPRDGRLELQPDGARAAAGLAHAVDDRVALRGADLGLDRSLERADHIARGDRAGLASQRVAATRAALAVHEAGLAERRDELLEICLGEILALRDGVQRHRSLTPVAREIDHEPHPVLATGGNVKSRGGTWISEHFTRNSSSGDSLTEDASAFPPCFGGIDESGQGRSGTPVARSTRSRVRSRGGRRAQRRWSDAGRRPGDPSGSPGPGPRRTRADQ